jgi:hypothetical protein
MRRNFGFDTCSAIPSSAARIEMPARIITASCSVKSRISFLDGPDEALRSSDSRCARCDAIATGASEMTSSPRPRSATAAAAALCAASMPETTSPRAPRT